MWQLRHCWLTVALLWSTRKITSFIRMLLKMSMVRKRLSGDCRFVHEMRCWRALTEVFTKCELAVLKFHCRGRVAGYSWLYKRKYTLVTAWRNGKLILKYCPFFNRFIFSRLWYLLVLLFWLVVFWANPNLVSMVFHLQGRCNGEIKDSGNEIELIPASF